MKSTALRHGFPLAVAGILVFSSMTFGQKVASHVRVVRLSYVSGTVGVRRSASSEWAKAQVNTPIQEGFEVSTAGQSYAEVEFENGSTARLGEFSRVSFDQLALDEHGNKLNRLTFERGYATYHILPEHRDEYSVKFADSTLTPNGKSEFRTDLDHGKARVEVFAGSVDLTTGAKTTKLGKDKVVEFNPGATELALNETQGIVKDSWDKWASSRDTQAQLSLSDQAVAPGGGFYGWSDLGAYGEWGFFPGYGYGWSPFAAAGWSPYNMGMWSFYPGMGYTWISSEPWGWLPYHYGNWNFSPGFGWFWMPGSFSTFSPALVSWYEGPGWIGWAPQGVIGMPGQNLVTTAPGTMVQNGVAISPANVNHMPVAVGTRVRAVPFGPGAGALLSGPMLTAGAQTMFTPHGGANQVLAPRSILMGGNAAVENSFEGGHSSHQPLQVRLGTTLGGSYAMRGGAGEFRGAAFAGAAGPRGVRGPEFGRNAGMGGPVLLPHGQQSAVFTHPGERGGMMQSRGGMMSNGSGVPQISGAAAPAVGSMGGGSQPISAPSGGGGGAGHAMATGGGRR